MHGGEAAAAVGASEAGGVLEQGYRLLFGGKLLLRVFFVFKNKLSLTFLKKVADGKF